MAKGASGVQCTTTSEGTGDLTLGNATTGHLRPRDVLVNGTVTYYRITVSDTVWEVGRGTLTSATNFTRDVVLRTSTGGVQALNLPAGTKTFSIVYPGEVAAFLDSGNRFTNHQYLGGWSLYMDADEDSFIRMYVDDRLEVFFAGIRSLLHDKSSLNLYLDDNDGAITGPSIRLIRTSDDPTVDDRLGLLDFQGYDASDTAIAYGRIRAYVKSAATGSAEGRLALGVAIAGATVDVMTINPGAVQIPDNRLLVGKDTSSDTTPGSMLDENGSVHAIVQNDFCFYANRRTGNGNIMEIKYNDSSVGNIYTNGTTTSYLTTSDARLKHIVGPVGDSGIIIDRLRPYHYEWLKTSEEEIGLLAQDVAVVVPWAVTGDPDGDVETAPMCGDWTKLVPILIAEVQSLRKRVAELERRQT